MCCLTRNAVQAWGLRPGAILVVGAEVHGMASWHQVTAALRRSDAHETRPAATLLMQAIVQHNRAAALSAAAPLTTAQQHSNKQQCALGQAQAPEQPPLLVVGYVMRPSRETALAAQGLLHLLPVRGLCYMPWEPDLDPEDQGHVDILLHKASDELVQGPPGGPPTWSPRMDRMLAWLATVPHVAVVDPLHAAAKART
jgi:Inositol 1,3,4-trisphosphate 5/6-kinase pre-ATP-grasp domain